MRSQRTTIGWLSALFLVTALLLIPQVSQAQGVEPLLPATLEGCYDVAVHGTGMFETGAGTIAIAPVDGTVVAAYLEWVGAEDTTPGGNVLDGTSTLTVNGVAVDGVLAGPLLPGGSAGYDPNAFTNAGPRGWLSWHADLGPDGYALVPAALDSAMTLAIADWDSLAKQTNGATVTIIYETESCVQETQLNFKTGVNWYYFKTLGHEQTELLVYPVKPEPLPRAARMYFSHAGTDKTQTECRGGAVWMVAGDDPTTMPGPTDYDLVATGDRSGDGIERGYGINGGVEILNDLFTSPALPCVPAVNPAPDEPYAAGHPYPGGAATAPYRAVSLNPPTGGDLGAPGEWGIVEAVVTIPANASWVAFQLESEIDQNGESGSWVGGGVFIILPPAAIGDRVWHDVDRDGIQDVGEPGISGVPVALLDGSDHTIATTATDTTGIYEFAQLVTGNYKVHFGPLPDGYVFTTAHVESGPEGDAGDSDADPSTGMTPVTTLSPGETDLTWDAGLVRLRPAIEIEKLPDLQQVAPGDTATFAIEVRNSGELDLLDVSVTDPLASGCDRVIGDLAVGASTTYTCTAPNVLVDFINVATVTGKDRFGEVVTDDDDAVVDVLPLIEVAKLATPETVSTEGGLVSFAVTVFNRVQEPLILDSLVDEIFGDLRGQGTCALPQTIPVGGSYTCNFNGVIPPGELDHRNVVTAEAHDDEGNPTTDDDDAIVNRVKKAAPSSVGDFVWSDLNGDGIQDAGEQGVAGVLVRLYAADDDALMGEALTDGAGLYLIEGLEAGSYYLEFFASGVAGQFSSFTLKDQGDNDLIDSDVGPDGLTGRTVVFALPAETDDLSWDAGLLVPTADDTTDEPVPPGRVFLPVMMK